MFVYVYNKITGSNRVEKWPYKIIYLKLVLKIDVYNLHLFFNANFSLDTCYKRSWIILWKINLMLNFTSHTLMYISHGNDIFQQLKHIWCMKELNN